MRISDWSSDVCSSDLADGKHVERARKLHHRVMGGERLELVGRGRKGKAGGGRCLGGEIFGKARRGVEPRPHRSAALRQPTDRKSTRLNSSHYCASRMPSSA